MKQNDSAKNVLAEMQRAEIETARYNVERFIKTKAAKKRKINIFDCCAKEDAREALKGVFHEKGTMVASNGNILCAIKEGYDPELEGKILTKKGEFIENSKYPNWNMVLIANRVGTGSTYLPWTAEAFKKAIYEEEKKCGKDKKVFASVFCDNDLTLFFQAKPFKIFLDFLREYSNSKIAYSNTCLQAFDDKGNIFLIANYGDAKDFSNDSEYYKVVF